MSLAKALTFCLLSVGFCLHPILGNPVTFKDGKMLDIQSDTEGVDIQAFYSLSSSMALGIHTVQSAEEAPVLLAQSNLLLRRWNNPDSQANLYSFIGIGESKNHFAEYLGLETDWESRSFYMAFSTDVLWNPAPFSRLSGRIGFAPYIGDYDDLHTWIILQASQSREQASLTYVLPIIRLFKDNFLMEFGTNGSFYDGNFRLHF